MTTLPTQPSSKPRTWQSAIAQYADNNTPYVLATIVETSGSTPRETGGKMVITEQNITATIGGGQFEQLVIEEARAMLSASSAQQQVRHYPLAAAAMQCCGGSVTVLLESFAVNLPKVVIVGAGHVGRKICQLLAELPVNTTLVDSRQDWLAENQANRTVCGPATEFVDHIQSQSIALILTHDHLLDYELISGLLPRQDLKYLGLIGSQTKWRNFRQRLLRDGFSEQDLARVTSPIGLPGMTGKSPMAVAISTVAQLMQGPLQAPMQAATTKSKTWRDLRKV